MVNMLPAVDLWLKFQVLFSLGLPFRFRLISMSVFVSVNCADLQISLQQYILALTRMNDRLYDRPQISLP